MDSDSPSYLLTQSENSCQVWEWAKSATFGFTSAHINTVNVREFFACACVCRLLPRVQQAGGQHHIIEVLSAPAQAERVLVLLLRQRWHLQTSDQQEVRGRNRSPQDYWGEVCVSALTWWLVRRSSMRTPSLGWKLWWIGVCWGLLEKNTSHHQLHLRPQMQWCR